MYVVVLRTKGTDELIGNFGCFKQKRNAEKRVAELEEQSDNCYYRVEEVDPLGSFANDETED